MILHMCKLESTMPSDEPELALFTDCVHRICCVHEHSGVTANVNIQLTSMQSTVTSQMTAMTTTMGAQAGALRAEMNTGAAELRASIAEDSYGTRPLDFNFLQPATTRMLTLN